MSMTKRTLALLLAVLLMVGVLPMQTHAAETGTAITATELPGLSRLEQPSDEKETEAYAPDEPVTTVKRARGIRRVTFFRLCRQQPVSSSHSASFTGSHLPQ